VKEYQRNRKGEIQCIRPYCYRSALQQDAESADDPLCGPHTRGAAARAKNDERRKKRSEATAARWAVENAKRSFALAWQARNRDQTYTSPRSPCPLCGLVIQQSMKGIEPHPLPYFPIYTDQEVIKAHQEAHGQDWIDYENAGQQPAEGSA
jgi:hypothetical protein